MRFQFHFRKVLWKICMQNIKQVFFMTLFQIFKCGRAVYFLQQTPTVWCWGIRISWNPVAIFKNTNMSALRHNSEKSKKIVLHCEKSASECLRHMASLYIFFLRLQFKLVLAWVYISGSGACYREILTAFLSTKHETTGFYHGPNTSHN